MILELVLYPLFLFGHFIISLIPEVSGEFGGVSQLFVDFLSTGMYFFGKGTFMLIIGSITFWFTVGLSWSVIEWIYKKIPGVS